MSLIVRISVNQAPLETVAARRLTGTDDPDSVNTYAVDHYAVGPDGWAQTPASATVEHRYGDGALALAEMAIAAVRAQ